MAGASGQEGAHRQQWLAENAGALADYERFVEEHGVFNETEREW